MKSTVRVGLIAAGGAVLIAAGVLTALSVPPSPSRAPTAASRPIVSATPTPTPTALPDAVPTAPTGSALAAVPLAFYDAVIPALPDPAALDPESTWQIAAPLHPLVGLYAAPGADQTLIAALGSRVPSVNTPTAVAVYGAERGMILISTPSRRTVPGAGSPSAPSATFAWARAADFRITAIDRVVKVDNATSVISIVDRSDRAAHSETARLGTATDPTPADTSTYLEADYIDTRIAYTQGNPIALTGAHSSLLPGYGGNSALTALHFYPELTGSSHGCVRISADMTRALAALPVGTPVLFS